MGQSKFAPLDLRCYGHRRFKLTVGAQEANVRSVYVVSGGVSKFAKSRPDKTFQGIVKEAYDYAVADIGLDIPAFNSAVDGSVASYFSDHFNRQLKAGAMVQDYLGLCPKPSHRVEGGGATGGLSFQDAWKSVASGFMDVCVVFGWEAMRTLLQRGADGIQTDRPDILRTVLG